MNAKMRKRIKRAEAAVKLAQQKEAESRANAVTLAERNRSMKDALFRSFGSIDVYEQPHDRTVVCSIRYYVDPRERIDHFTDRLLSDMRFKIVSEIAIHVNKDRAHA